MNAPAAPPRRRRGSWFADRPVGVKIARLITFSALVGVVLAAVAMSRIEGQRTGEHDIYVNHVVAFSTWTPSRRPTRRCRPGTPRTSWPHRPSGSLKPQLADGTKQLQARLAAYAEDQPAPGERGGPRRRPPGVRRAQRAADGRRPSTPGTWRRRARSRQGPMVPAEQKVTADIHGLRSVLRSEADDQVVADGAQGTAAIRDLWLILGVSVLLGVALALAVVRQITGTVRRVQRSVEALAAGDLTAAPRSDQPRRARPDGGRAGHRRSGNLRGVLPAWWPRRTRWRRRSEELSASSAQISASAEETSAQSGVVSAAAEEVVAERADGRRGRGADGRVDPGDRRRTRPRRREVAARGGDRGGDHDGDGRASWASPRRRSATW